ncbi:MAG: ATP-binding protein [Eubacterium sp.]|nr:ATP-binding protein [Eubacterium sp.]
MSDIRLPIGIQNFESLIKDGFIYIDKTEYIYKLAHGNGRAFFLSRPRRFGKSLFLSALKAYWEGKRDLFAGLKIDELEGDWEPHPVFYFDFNKENFREEGGIERVLSDSLRSWEEEYGVNKDEIRTTLAARFQYLIEKVYKDTEKTVVVLVDEYDKPLLENGGTAERLEYDKAVFKGFFSTLKSYDEYIRFSFLTGVTKFSKVSIFSDLNHLDDISMDEDFSSICGITEAEIHDNFDSLVGTVANKNDLTTDECYKELKRMYDGYHFHQNTEGVYNPFSLLNALNKKEFGFWWFETGTPTFLIEKIKKGNYDFKKITEGEVYADEATLKDYRDDNPDPVPLLYQSGYLTIVSYDRDFRSYELSYPNEEVKYGFINSLIKIYLSCKDEPRPLDIRSFGIDIKRGNTDGLRDRFTALYASLPYPTDKDAEKIIEQNFQNVAYLTFTLLGQFVHTEVHTAKGRADIVVETDDYVYIIEFKRDTSADEALAQIEEQGYATPYAADPRTLIKIGANFDSGIRTLNEWKVM